MDNCIILNLFTIRTRVEKPIFQCMLGIAGLIFVLLLVLVKYYSRFFSLDYIKHNQIKQSLCMFPTEEGVALIERFPQNIFYNFVL